MNANLKSITLRSIFLLSLVAAVLLSTAAQEKPTDAPRFTDLLTFNGSKPNLKADGEGLTSYKTALIFKPGVTRVKPIDSTAELKLPAGYTLFNNLAYVVDTEVVFSGPNQIVLRVPSAQTTEVFNQLRILCAAYDPAEPDKPQWIDMTVTPEIPEQALQPTFSRTALLPNFATRTLNAVTSDSTRMILVALRDERLARDNFTAELRLKAAVTADSVMEGREISYFFEITNDGPDSATDVGFASQIGPEFVSLDQTQGKCRFEAQNIYCNLGELKKGATARITYRGTCPWDFIFNGQPRDSNGMYAYSSAGSAEMDSNLENNMVHLSTPVVADPNQKPIVSIVKPADETFLVGPKVNLNIVANASDPDGSIAKVEFFGMNGSLGLGKLTAPNTYEIPYQAETYGRHILRAVATDNRGRPAQSQFFMFIVNGPIQIQITDPKPNLLLDPPRDKFVVKLKATNPKGKIKEIVVYVSATGGSHLEQPARLVGKDEYAATFTALGWECSWGPCSVWAVAKDDADVQTRSSVVTFRVANPK